MIIVRAVIFCQQTYNEDGVSKLIKTLCNDLNVVHYNYYTCSFITIVLCITMNKISLSANYWTLKSMISNTD